MINQKNTKLANQTVVKGRSGSKDVFLQKRANLKSEIQTADSVETTQPNPFL
ncbi:hypothetical protein LEP1GSC036_3350 [Leptospira weilii str. 2006001853]|uniref:Uncharacterized protein n=2 Tax=Leptospira weilii TaxID=28184 RepID=A0A828Z0H2_9LEPT|nr:hypothetical protein LEP1GSC036_3350 [Leptospira weilii str. 2006001853]EMJ67114.1 hypothetical protein LEP1GSC051_3716 [Leptospira sp. P2653]EMN44434.1 hypothetical protein LEP1GSC086_3506 [Leptospira weilii str. LNT 1234]EMN89235.1 hypothetical protein LEP1GSC108_4513 [Leptospira weilii str. UI 13098]